MPCYGKILMPNSAKTAINSGYLPVAVNRATLNRVTMVMGDDHPNRLHFSAICHHCAILPICKCLARFNRADLGGALGLLSKKRPAPACPIQLRRLCPHRRRGRG